MATIRPEPPRVETDFTDALLTGQGGWALVARLARDMDLPARLATAVQVKRRRRGASDGEMLWSLIGSLTAGNGALSDGDALRGDAAGRCLLGLEEAPSGRRLGEYLARFGADEIAGLEAVVRDVSRSLAPSVVADEVAQRAYVAGVDRRHGDRGRGRCSRARALVMTARCRTGCTRYSSAGCGRARGCIAAASMSPAAGASSSSATSRRCSAPTRRCGCTPTTPITAGR